MYRILFLLMCCVLTDIMASHEDEAPERPPGRAHILRVVRDARASTAEFLASVVRLARHPLDGFRDLGGLLMRGLDHLDRAMRMPPRPIVIREPGGGVRPLHPTRERWESDAFMWDDDSAEVPVVVIQHTPLEHARCDLDIWLRENSHHLDEGKQRDVRSLWHLTAPDVSVTLENLDEGLAYLRRIGDSSPCYRLCVETAYHLGGSSSR